MVNRYGYNSKNFLFSIWCLAGRRAGKGEIYRRDRECIEVNQLEFKMVVYRKAAGRVFGVGF